MSLGQPDLYIAGALVAGNTTAAVTALAGATVNWGNDSRVDFAGPATLTIDVLVKSGAMPAWSNGAQLGLVDPVTGRCIFAGHISNLTAAPDPALKTAVRITISATSPLADLKNHTIYDFDWAASTQASRFAGLASTIARGWTMTGYTGLTWIGAGRIKFQEKNWLELTELWCRSNLGRYHDTSSYVPGAGFVKRLTITRERAKTAPAPVEPVGDGQWSGTGKAQGSDGLATLPTNVIGRDIEWEKNPEDTITDVKVATYGGAIVAADADSKAFAYNMEAAGVNNQALQDAYGFRQVSFDTDIVTTGGGGATDAWLANDIVPFWLDVDSAWRPTGISIPDGNVVDQTALLSLMATDTRHMACVYVPAGPGINPGKIHSYVTRGRATWTGKKWTAELTLGRTFD